MQDPLIAALEDAIEGMEEMINYVPEYFREKWGHDDYLRRARQALDLAKAGGSYGAL